MDATKIWSELGHPEQISWLGQAAVMATVSQHIIALLAASIQRIYPSFPQEPYADMWTHSAG
jgi:hypothetical protein